MRGLFFALAVIMNVGQPSSSDVPKAILEQQTTAVICLNAKFRVSYMNNAAEILFAVTAHKAVGLPLDCLASFTPGFISRLHDAFDQERYHTEREVSFIRAGVTAPKVDCTISPIQSENNKRCLLLELHDIDQRIKAAKESAMLSQQESSRHLLRGLAHEIKNPLGGLRGAAQLLEGELEDESLHEYTGIIIREADRLHQLIDRMLGPHALPKPQVVNVHEILEYVRTLTQAEAPETVSFKTDYDPSIPEFSADRDHFIQVFLNITGNALQALQGKGSITFCTRVARYVSIGSRLHKLVGIFKVIDNGPGIPEALRDSLFYPMTTGRVDGTGLGLSIAQSLINQQGGIIEYQSTTGNTEFSVTVPLEVGDDS